MSKKIVVSRDVIFEDNKCWNWGKSNEEARIDTLEWEDSNIEGSEHDPSEEESEEEVVAKEEEVVYFPASHLNLILQHLEKAH